MVYVCSDLHGDYSRYQALLEKISFSSRDTLYVLGDVIDRGPDGISILRDMMARPNIVPILGNHELTAAICLPWLLEQVTDQSISSLGAHQIAALGEWVTNGGSPTLRELQLLHREEREELLDYIQEMELYAQVTVAGRSFVLVHAGLDHFSPDKPLEAYELEDFLFCRPNLDTTYYTDQYLVYGHTPTCLLRQPRENVQACTILRRGTQIAIDCGCGHGGNLGGLCLDTLQEYYV